MSKGQVGILISGRGSNMLSLIEGMREGRIAAEPAVVISNRPDAEGLKTADSFGIPTAVVDHKQVKPRAEHERQVVALLEQHKVDLVCLAGYMRLLTPFLVSRFQGRMFNIHPSLLPAFPGLDAQKQALDYGAKVAGCTVHVVNEGCDQGPIVLQATVPVREGDTEQSLSRRILREEHRIYPEAVSLYFDRRLQIDDRRVKILDPVVG